MHLLAIDTALGDCSAAILIDDDRGRQRLHKVSRSIGRGHAEQLMDVLAATLAAAKITYADIDRIAVTVGPGSYTGLRVGLATARALALVLSVPVIGVTTLAALAEEADLAGCGGTGIALIDARHGAVYCQVTAPDGTTDGPMIRALTDLADELPDGDLVLVGSGTGPAAQILSRQDRSIETLERAAPSIDAVARLGARLSESVAPPKPLYLKPPDARPQTRGRIARTS